MINETVLPRRSTGEHIRLVLQWFAFGFLALFAVMVATELRKVNAPGAPVAVLYGTIGVAGLLALVHLPAIFGRLPRRGQIGAYVSIIAVLALFGFYADLMAPVWERTPQGAKEAAEQATLTAREAKEKAARDETARSLADLENTKKELESLQKRLEACFSWGHRLSGLEEPVKASLHNPDAFQHVETIVIVPDEQRNNVQMTFRAENGFGALRTAIVRAQLIPDDCTVQNIGEPTIG